MLPASNVVITSVNVFTEEITSTINSKGVTIGQDCFPFDWNPSNCN